MKQAHLEINYPYEVDGKEYSGLDVEADIINVGIKQDIIKKGGSWFTYGEFKTQGLEKFKAHLLQNEDLYQQLYSEVMETFN